jgi:glutamyl-tRNA synthetase/glutamyl-Q tRNA(Asp) synthetase
MNHGPTPSEKSALLRPLTDALLAGKVAAALPELAAPLVTRFAPSPTGELHLGHVLHAAWVWGVAEGAAARILVRMEDHDRSRCTPAFERSILADLAWLGFATDHPSLASLAASPSPYRQSDVPERYQAAFDDLARRGLVYGCTCTRADLGAPGPDGERRYPGNCRGQPIDRPGTVAVRVQLPDAETLVTDLRMGPLHQHPAREHGDPVIRDARGQWTYQFCVVVDDMQQGVNLIVRGEDLVSSTGRQWLLAQLLGRTAPFVTVHHPLLLAADGKKLSKRDRSETVRAMRERGLRAEEVWERAVREA